MGEGDKYLELSFRGQEPPTRKRGAGDAEMEWAGHPKGKREELEGAGNCQDTTRTGRSNLLQSMLAQLCALSRVYRIAETAVGIHV